MAMKLVPWNGRFVTNEATATRQKTARLGTIPQILG